MRKSPFLLVTSVLCAAFFLQFPPIAQAQTYAAVEGNVAGAATPLKNTSRSYFVEFRSRSAMSYGHTFAVYGRVGTKVTAANVVGLHPATESSVPWMIGHVVLVPSETGASDGDTEDMYITARYRILLTEPEYRQLVTQMKYMQNHSPMWHAVLYNCNAFVGDIAKYLGLKTPTSTLLMPKDFITSLREVNGGRKTPVTIAALEH